MNLFNIINNYKTDEDFNEKLKHLGLSHFENSDTGLTLIKYNQSDKKKYNFENELVKYARGLIFDRKTRKIVCIPPEKSIHIVPFSQNISIEEWVNVGIEDFIDGTMINCFNHDGSWHISTRSFIGAHCKWFSQKKFNELFNEAKGKLEFEKLNPLFCYTFVLKHPENRIVTSYEKPDLVLVQANWGWNEVNIHQVAEELRGHGMEIKTPQVYQVSSLEEILEKIASMEYQEQGLVLRFNNTRAKIRNPKYEQAKLLRGNNRNLFFTYLEHFKNHRVGEYLTYYPEHKEQFDDWFEKIKAMTTKLHTCYVEGFIRHNMDRTEIPYELKPHCYALHNLHKTTGNKVTKKYAIEYFNGLDIPQIIFIINYEKNKEYYESKAKETAVTAETLLKEIEQKVEAVSEAVQENA